MANTEDVEQIKVVDWIRYNTDLPVHANINQGRRSFKNAHILKRMGLTKGVPDLTIPRATSSYHGVYIEVKTIDGKTSLEQELYLQMLRKEGYFAEAIAGADAIIDKVKEIYGSLIRVNPTSDSASLIDAK